MNVYENKSTIFSTWNFLMYDERVVFTDWSFIGRNHDWFKEKKKLKMCKQLYNIASQLIMNIQMCSDCHEYL